MGRIEDAIEHAKRRQQIIATPRAIETQATYAMVKVEIKPARHHDVDPAFLRANRILPPGKDDRLKKPFHILRTKLIQDFRTNRRRTLGITAPNYGAGKTVAAVNLAISLAEQGGHTVFLVDADLKRPRIAKYLGLPDDAPGLALYLESDHKLNAYLWTVGVERLIVLPAGDGIDDSSNLIFSERMHETLNALRMARDDALVVLNLPPILAGDDVLAIAPGMDSLVVIAAERETKRQDVKRAIELLDGSTSLNVVLNKASDA